MTDHAKPQMLVTPAQSLMFQPLKIDTGISDALIQIGRAVSQIQASFTEAVNPLGHIFSAAFKDAERAKAVQEAGWLPHATTPIDQFDKDTPQADIDGVLTAHYRDNWQSVREIFSQSVLLSGVDDEAKATFEEALAAHEAGLYRSVVRVLFPEIERVARETVYDGSRKEAPRGRQTVGNNNASLRDFRNAIMDLPAGTVLGIPYAMTLVEKLVHLYEYVPEDERLAVFQRDPVPNRHASQHGYVIYSSAQNSINMLVIADFLFHIIMEANSYLDGVAREEAVG